MNPLAEIIRSEIAEQGLISFARFMELALYFPKLGYYERSPLRVGSRGDYITSASVGPLFGELLAAQFADWLEALGRGQFQIVEAGCHEGQVAADVLLWFRRRRPALFQRLEYCILEPSVTRQDWQRERLSNFGNQVRWYPSWSALSPSQICGVIFANELLDAFPVRRIGWDAKEGRWFEWGVACHHGRFAWEQMEERPVQEPERDSPPVWPELPSDLLAVLPDGFTTELSPGAEAWWSHAAVALGRGKLMTLDYGLLAEQFFTPERTAGTLRAYRQHHLNPSVLDNAGEQDLTSHVNFTGIQRAGKRAGLRTESFLPQSKFLTTIAARAEKSPHGFDEWTPSRIRQFQMLTHPEHLGQTFQVLIQSRA